MAKPMNPDRKYERPLGATDGSPLVVLTADISDFLHRNLEVGPDGRPSYDKVVQQIKTCKAHGQIVTGVSYDVLKRIYENDGACTADNTADAILISQGATDSLGKDIPLYRNPFIPEWKYFEQMKKRLRKGWQDELDGPWNEKEQVDYIKSFPRILPL
jgi:hypothetical protein